MTKLTASDVQRIRERYEQGYSPQEIANEFEVTRPHIIKILGNKHWCDFDYTMETILERLCAARQKAHITRDVAAYCIDVDEQAFRKIENGEHPLTIAHLLKLCDFYRASPTFVFCGALMMPMRDRPKHKLTKSGGSWNKKLTDQDCHAIRVWWLLGYTQTAIAETYHVSSQWVQMIISDKARVSS